MENINAVGEQPAPLDPPQITFDPTSLTFTVIMERRTTKLNFMIANGKEALLPLIQRVLPGGGTSHINLMHEKVRKNPEPGPHTAIATAYAETNSVMSKLPFDLTPEMVEALKSVSDIPKPEPAPAPVPAPVPSPSPTPVPVPAPAPKPSFIAATNLAFEPSNLSVKFDLGAGTTSYDIAIIRFRGSKPSVEVWPKQTFPIILGQSLQRSHLLKDLDYTPDEAVEGKYLLEVTTTDGSTTLVNNQEFELSKEQANSLSLEAAAENTVGLKPAGNFEIIDHQLVFHTYPGTEAFSLYITREDNGPRRVWHEYKQDLTDLGKVHAIKFPLGTSKFSENLLVPDRYKAHVTTKAGKQWIAADYEFDLDQKQVDELLKQHRAERERLRQEREANKALNTPPKPTPAPSPAPPAPSPAPAPAPKPTPAPKPAPAPLPVPSPAPAPAPAPVPAPTSIVPPVPPVPPQPGVPANGGYPLYQQPPIVVYPPQVAAQDPDRLTAREMIFGSVVVMVLLAIVAYIMYLAWNTHVFNMTKTAAREDIASDFKHFIASQYANTNAMKVENDKLQNDLGYAQGRLAAEQEASRKLVERTQDFMDDLMKNLGNLRSTTNVVFGDIGDNNVILFNNGSVSNVNGYKSVTNCFTRQGKTKWESDTPVVRKDSCPKTAFCPPVIECPPTRIQTYQHAPTGAPIKVCPPPVAYVEVPQDPQMYIPWGQRGNYYRYGAWTDGHVVYSN